MNELLEIIAKMEEIENNPETTDGWDAWVELKEWLDEKQKQAGNRSH
jgi:hypothetical protein